MSSGFIADLIVLVADATMETAIREILERTSSLGIRKLSYEVLVHPCHDPGCYKEGHVYLRSFNLQYRYAIVILDKEGSGQENKTRVQIEAEVEHNLEINGWEGRSSAIVIEPELENWAWSTSPHVDRVFGWINKSPNLRESLAANGLLPQGCIKPIKPKETMLWALRQVQKPLSSSLYRDLAAVVSLARCVDESFLKLKSILYKWFNNS